MALWNGGVKEIRPEWLKECMCPVCKGPFRAPKMLPQCGHSFCLECIIGIVGGSSSINCPECKLLSIIGPKGPQAMKTNVLAENALKIVMELCSQACFEPSSNLDKESPSSSSTAANDASDEVCSHVSAKSPRSCRHCSQKICGSCEIGHREIIKVEVLETVRKFEDLEKPLAEKVDSLLGQIAEKMQDGNTRCVALHETLEEAVRSAIASRKGALCLLIREICDHKSEEVKEAAENLKCASKGVLLEIQRDLPTKSVLHMSLDDLAKMNEKVLNVQKMRLEFEKLAQQVANSSVIVKNDERLRSDLIALLMDQARRTVVKWTEQSQRAEAADPLAKLHQAIDEGSLEDVIEALDQPDLSPAGMSALVEKQDSAFNNRTALVHSTAVRNLDIVKYLIKNCRANIFSSSPNENDVTAAHIASSNGFSEILRYLIESDPAVCTLTDRFGASPLSHASYLGHVDCVKLLLEQKVTDLENQGEAKRTPLLYAASSGRRSVLELLIEKGANLEARDEKGMTALHLASYFGYASVVRFLIRSHPSLIDAKDMFGQTAANLANSCGKSEIVAIFQEADRLLAKAASLKANNF